MVTVFIPDIPEFQALVAAAQKITGCVVHRPRNGYWRLQGEQELRFSRKALGLGPAIWNSALSGGFIGRIIEYGRESMHIESDIK
jgi:hypothetical protein